MDYSTFLQQITKEIEERVDHSAKVQISRIQKVNLPSAKGMTILFPGENTSPTIYMERFYQEYLEGTSLSSIADEVLSFYREHRSTCSFDFSFYTDFDKVKNRIVCRLINYEKNRTLLEDVPHQRFLDLAIVYYYQMENRLLGKSSVLVKKSHMDMWGIRSDFLHTTAVRNTRRLLPFRITTLGQMLQDMTEVPFPWSEREHTSMYILTNEELCFGAVNMIFDDILYTVGNQLKSDFYILPSSIHECLLLPITSWEDSEPQRLQEIVSEINREYIDSEEILGDHIYRYTRASHDLRLEA